MKRNLLYSCTPFSWNEEWQMNIHKLRSYIDVFNGRRLVLVRTDARTATLADVRHQLGFSAELLEIPNDSKLWETAGFIDALSGFESLDENEITFYAHTKGVRYHEPKDASRLKGVRIWRDLMYEKLLSDIALVDHTFKTKACIGVFRVRTPNSRMWGPFFYTGNFWWVKHSALFSRDWRKILLHPLGVESYLGNLFTLEESACLYSDNMTCRPYDFFCPDPKRPFYFSLRQKAPP